MENEILNLLLETLKIQAEKYKVIVNDDSLTHEQRKEFDTEITQMYNVLANLSNSSTIYTLAELKALKAQYDVKFAEFYEKVKNLDLSHLLVSFDSLTQEQKDSLKGEKGDKGEDGSNGTFEDLTQEQKDSLRGAIGLSAYEIAKNEGYEGTELEWLESLIGENGLSAYELAVNNGFEGTQSEWLESLKGSGAGEGGANLSLPIEIQDVNELGSNLAQIFQTLGTLQGAISGGTIAGININQLDGQFQGFRNSSTSQLDYINKILQGGELYNVALDTTIQYEGLMNIVQDLTSRIMVLEDK